ncbi:30S ribosomal protein S17e [Candidatus Woesearchaeota archaeon]|nr:30S ribosomal protein S17e [Candidatus Woesearchaeota archaeon]
MGRVKTALIKRIALKTCKDYPDKFGEDFGNNKKIASEFVDFPSKKLRNVITGYITRIVKQRKKNK